MIAKLSISNFKSIRQFDLNCRRVNVFIGEPNAGKTNILESLGLWCPGVRENLMKVCRLTWQSDLFWRQDATLLATVVLDDFGLVVTAAQQPRRLIISRNNAPDKQDSPTWKSTVLFESGELQNSNQYGESVQTPETGFYIFQENAVGQDMSSDRLAPPYGENLAALLTTNREARQLQAAYFEGQYFRPRADRTQNMVVLSHEEDDVFVTLPYQSASETLRRMVFHHLAIQTNKNASLIFDEPEAHAFPPYTKTLAETIALDDQGNQFFLTTHSPYMLDSLLSKTPAKDLNVILCRMENFETKGYVLDQDQIDQIKEWSMDAFFNFDRLLPPLA